MGVQPQITMLPGAQFAKTHPIVFDNDNTSLYSAQAEAVHARYAFIKAPDNLYGTASSRVASGDLRAFNGGQVTVPPQTPPPPG